MVMSHGVNLGFIDSHVSKSALSREMRRKKKKIPAVFKNMRVAKKKVHILKSKMNVHVIPAAPFP